MIPMNEHREMFEVFMEETLEQLEQMERALLLLEERSEDRELLNRVFRTAHTMKGSSAAMGFIKVAELTHAMEDILHWMRDGNTTSNESAMEILFVCYDFLKRSFAHIRKEGVEDRTLTAGMENITGRLHALVGKGIENRPHDPELIRHLYREAETILHSIRIHAGSLEAGVQNKEAILGLFKGFHTVRSMAGFVGNPLLRECAFRNEVLLDKYIKSGQGVEQTSCDGLVKSVEYMLPLCTHPKDGPVYNRQLAEHMEELMRLADSILVERSGEEPADESAPEALNMRIPGEKLELLVEELSDLQALQSVLRSRAAKSFGSGDPLVKYLVRMEKVAREMQNLAFTLQKVPLKRVLPQIIQEVRKAAASQPVQVNFSFSGEETVLDAGMAEPLVNPLIHILSEVCRTGERICGDGQAPVNDHKSRVVLNAYPGQDAVILDIYREGAVSGPYEQPDTEVFTELLKMGGKMAKAVIKDRGPGLRVKIPEKAVRVDGMVAVLGKRRYIVPTSYIRRVFKPQLDQWVFMKNRRVAVNTGDELMGLVRPEPLLDENEQWIDCEDDWVMVLEVDGKRRALMVSSIDEKREFAAKRIPRHLPGFSHALGVSVLDGNGISIILDVEDLFDSENQ